jgi:hypothetical protein
LKSLLAKTKPVMVAILTLTPSPSPSRSVFLYQKTTEEYLKFSCNNSKIKYLLDY